MTHLVEIAFKGNRREFFRWERDEALSPRTAVIVEVERGEDLGRVHSVGESAAQRCGGCAHGCGAEPPPRRVVRVATADEERRAGELRAQDEDARRRAMERVKAHGLVMKVSDAEWQWDRKKLTFYFTAEKRVDFRALVRDLASTFRTRIELKQIGVRDEAKRLSGIGRCGREYCSASWLPELRPVNLQVAKDQRLSLNPSQISGACGRLMCCLRYEHDFYVQSRKRFPKEGKVLVTARGEEKVVANDIFNDRVTLRGADGDARIVPLADLKRELEGRPAHADEAGEAYLGDVAALVDTDQAVAESSTLAGDDAVPDEDAPPALGGPVANATAPRPRRRPEEAGDGRARRYQPSPRPAEDAAGAGGPPAGPPAGRRRGRRGGRRNRGDGDGAARTPSEE